MSLDRIIEEFWLILAIFLCMLLIVQVTWRVISLPQDVVEVSVEITEYGTRAKNGVLVDMSNRSIIAEAGEWAKIDSSNLDRYGVMVEINDRHVVIPLETFEEKSTLYVAEDGRILHSSPMPPLIFSVPIAAVLTYAIIRFCCIRKK